MESWHKIFTLKIFQKYLKCVLFVKMHLINPLWYKITAANMILKFVIKCIKMSIERIVTAQPTSDISGTFNMWVKCQHGRKEKLPNVIFLILTFILLIGTPQMSQTFFLLDKRKAIVIDVKIDVTTLMPVCIR